MRPWQEDVSQRCGEIFDHHDAALTLGGEPTFVPIEPEGAEWSYAAVGPTKLIYAQKMARHLLGNALRGGVAFFSPGKSYPGEVNPRWVVRIIANRDGSPILKLRRQKAIPTGKALENFRSAVADALGIEASWAPMSDPRKRGNRVWALLLDKGKKAWKSTPWPKGRHILTEAEGPAGLRLPLGNLPKKTPRRALTMEWDGKRLAIFLPPVAQSAFVELLEALAVALETADIGQVEMQGYVPSDEDRLWIQLGLTADPGVLEINLPVCADWREYDYWLHHATQSAAAVGLRPWKEPRGNFAEGTGGGNHLLWGGATLDTNPFFTRPEWLASILRYFQQHPSLAYLFTGCYVGASSQAPRTDESARDLHDLEMAWSFLGSLESGIDHRDLIGETLRHLQVDVTGNSHRSEISFDKFWNLASPGGALGLIEFRAIESLPRADWMSGVALLWTALAARLLEKPYHKKIKAFGRDLHDVFFLPTILWGDLCEILSDLHAAGFALDKSFFREIWEWKFPVMLHYKNRGAELIVRRAHENWPLLCETPLDGGTTSRFVDTSMRRLECVANDAFLRSHELRINNRPLYLSKQGEDFAIGGIRFRQTNLYPSLHPGLPPQMPLEIGIVSGKRLERFVLSEGDQEFQSSSATRIPRAAAPCRGGRAKGLACDLRIS